MIALELDVNVPCGTKLDAWMRERSHDGISIVTKEEAGPSGHPVITVYADTPYDMDAWLRNHYVEDSAGPAQNEDVLMLMAKAYNPAADEKPSTKMTIVATAFGGMVGVLSAIGIMELIHVVFHVRIW